MLFVKCAVVVAVVVFRVFLFPALGAGQEEARVAAACPSSVWQDRLRNADGAADAQNVVEQFNECVLGVVSGVRPAPVVPSSGGSGGSYRSGDESSWIFKEADLGPEGDWSDVSEWEWQRCRALVEARGAVVFHDGSSHGLRAASDRLGREADRTEGLARTADARLSTARTRLATARAGWTRAISALESARSAEVAADARLAGSHRTADGAYYAYSSARRDLLAGSDDPQVQQELNDAFVSARRDYFAAIASVRARERELRRARDLVARREAEESSAQREVSLRMADAEARRQEAGMAWRTHRLYRSAAAQRGREAVREQGYLGAAEEARRMLDRCLG